MLVDGVMLFSGSCSICGQAKSPQFPVCAACWERVPDGERKRWEVVSLAFISALAKGTEGEVDEALRSVVASFRTVLESLGDG